MKICVCSDSHGHRQALEEMLRITRAEVVLFLGDGVEDMERIALPTTVYLAMVCGNGDMACREPDVRLLSLSGHKVLLAHGHKLAVKQGIDTLYAYGKTQGATLMLHGHTHQPNLVQKEDAIILCPGSIREGAYAMLTLIEGQAPHVQLCHLDEA